MWRSAGLLATGLVLVTVGFWWTRGGRARTEAAPASETASLSSPQPSENTILQQAAAVTGSPTATTTGKALYDPVVIGPCNIAAVEEQDLSSQVEGTVHDIVVDLGQQVRPGQLLARLDDRLLRPQVELLQIKAASDAARLIAKAQLDEADGNLDIARRLSAKGAMPPVEYRTYLYQRNRHAEELKKAEEDQEVARKELARAQRTLELYEIKSRLAGEVTRIYKRSGEAVKDTEPLLCVTNFDRLRIEGLCKEQQANLIRVGMRALVEPELRGEQLTELNGHTATVTSLAVSADGRLVASASEDRTVLLWQWPQGQRLAALRHPGEVLAVALAPPAVGRAGYRLLTGSADGRGRLWSLTREGKAEAPAILAEAHEGAIRAVAFSPDGQWCATGGEDRRIGIWETASGKRLYWVQPAEDSQEGAHQGAVTALHFTPDGHLVSAGRDNVLKVWKLGERSGALAAVHAGRSGDAGSVGISPDGRRVLFDHGEELRILDRQSGSSLGALRGLRQGRFHGFALFSPTGQAVLSASNNGRVQLWKVPADPDQARFFRQAYEYGFQRSSLTSLPAVGGAWTPAGLLPGWAALSGSEARRGSGGPGKAGTFAPTLWSVDGYEARYFQAQNPAAVTCGAFAPDERVIFTGGADCVIRVWSVPPAALWQQPLEAEITYVGSQVERGTDTVRVRAELPNPRDRARRLRPGTYANLRLYPETVPGR